MDLINRIQRLLVQGHLESRDVLFQLQKRGARHGGSSDEVMPWQRMITFHTSNVRLWNDGCAVLYYATRAPVDFWLFESNVKESTSPVDREAMCTLVHVVAEQLQLDLQVNLVMQCFPGPTILHRKSYKCPSRFIRRIRMHQPAPRSLRQ